MVSCVIPLSSHCGSSTRPGCSSRPRGRLRRVPGPSDFASVKNCPSEVRRCSSMCAAASVSHLQPLARSGLISITPLCGRAEETGRSASAMHQLHIFIYLLIYNVYRSAPSHVCYSCTARPAVSLPIIPWLISAPRPARHHPPHLISQPYVPCILTCQIPSDGGSPNPIGIVPGEPTCVDALIKIDFPHIAFVMTQYQCSVL